MNKLHWQTVSPELKEIILKISNESAFSGFRLCGGTALSLQLGHRVSVDADFVSEAYFDKDDIAEIVGKTLVSVSDLYIGDTGVFLKSNGFKVDFLSWNIPFIRANVMADGVSLLHVEEIAAMKLFAITRRGEKKDYIDIAYLLQTYTLNELISFYKTRHPNSDASIVVKFLLSFSDIESQPEPNMLLNFDWKKAKQILNDAVKNYLAE